jgi:O-antigen/teichoic acid export membrane protein
LLGALIAMLIAGVSPATALLGYAAGSLLIFGSLFRVASTADELHRARPQRSPIAGTVSSAAHTRIYGEIWQYVLPFLTWAAIGFAFMHGVRWMLQGVRGSEAVGTYMAIYQIGSALPNAVTAIISQHIEPLVFERAETSRSVQNELEGAALIRRAAFYTGLFLVAMVAIASVWSKEIVEFVTTPAIARHASVLAWVVAGTSMIGIAQILTIQGLALLQPSAYLICKSVAAIALLGAAYFGATLRGVDGVAMALALAGVVYLISVLYVNARLVQHQSL